MTNHRFRSRRRRLAASVGLVTTLAFATTACGSDGGDAAETTEAAAESTRSTESTDVLSTETVTNAAASDSAAFCDAEVDLEIIAAGTGDPSVDAVNIATTLMQPTQRAAALAPAELADDFEVALTALQTVVDTGDGSALEGLDSDGIQDYGLANCGWSPVSVEMTNYHFNGIPETMPAGDYSFAVTNGSPDPHVLVIVKKKDGVTDSWEDLLASPEGQGQVDTVAAAFAVTGGTEHAITRLEPGEYLALCPIAEGTTLETEGTGAPHFVLGMQQVLTVTE